ncbi:MAG: host attachment protein [Rhodocyclaceae bacterium]
MQANRATWIVAANAGHARFFEEADRAAPLEHLNDMGNAGARLRTADTESDQLGQIAASKGRHSAGAPSQPNGYQPKQSPAEHQTEIFARSVADSLLKAHNEGRYQHLVLAASPEFLGVLRKVMDPALTPLVSLCINKDFSQLDARQLRERIQVEKTRH